jgi:hypothetical protein
VFTVQPFRAVDYFGQNQQRLERIENTRFVKIEEGPSAQTAAINIGQVFASAPLGDDARHQIADPTGHRHWLDSGVFFGKGRDDVGMRDFLIAPKAHLAFFFCRRNDFFPINLPRRLRFGRVAKTEALHKYRE